MNQQPQAWTELTLSGYSVWKFIPENQHTPQKVLIYLHSSQEERLDAYPTLFEAATTSGYTVLCPMAGPTWWLDQPNETSEALPSAEALVAEHLVSYIEQEWKISPPDIALCGIGMGGQGALRMAYRFSETFVNVAAISPSIDFHYRWREGDAYLRRQFEFEELARQQTAILHIHPFKWAKHLWFCSDPEDYNQWEGADKLRMKLGSSGIPYACDLETTANGDRKKYIEKMTRPTMEWLNSETNT